MAVHHSQISSKMSLDDWSVREKLVLACSVVRSGDQNWASVSRTIKPICEAVERRAPEWFSQKSCANQYSSLLEGTSTKKRKRTSSESGANETPMEQIIRKLSFERIDELKKAIQTDRKKYKKLKNDIEKIRSGKVDDLLQKIWNDLHSGKNIPIETVIQEEAQEQPLLGAAFSDAPNVSMTTSGLPGYQQQHQQQSSAVYHRSKSQRQPKATKKFESWMTQLKQQQARHHQSHSGSAQGTPHGQPPSSQGAGDLPQQTDVTASPGMRPQGFYQHPFTHRSPFHAQQLQQQQSQQQQEQQDQFQQEQQMILQQQQQQQSKQFLQQQQQPQQQQQINQRQGYPQLASRSQPSGESTSSAHACESGSVLSSLLVAPTSEIKAAAALQQQKMKEDHLASKDVVSTTSEGKAASTSSNLPTTTNSAFSTAPTLSKLLEPSSKAQPPQRQVLLSSSEVQEDEEGKPAQEKESPPKEGNSASQILPASTPSARLSPVAQNKTTDSSPISKKSSPESSRTTPLEPLRIKVEDEDYFPDNEGMATPDSSQPSPKARTRRTKGKRGLKRKQPHHILLKNLESLQDSEDTCSVDELASERDETESEVASVSDAKEISDMEQEDGEDGGYHKMSEDAREHGAMRRSRGRTISSNLSGGILQSPNSPTLSVGSNEENSQAQKNWRKSIMLVWKSIASHKYANVFMHPVTNDEAPGYHSIVKRPMDLSTIKKNIETGGIRCTREFRRDVMLMFQNALMYNREDHDVHRMAEEMREEVMEQIQSFIATQLHLLVQSSDRDTMMLRGHRSDDEKVELRRSKNHSRSSHKV